MSEVGGVHDTFLQETQSLSFNHPDVNPPDPGSNTQTPKGKEVAAAIGLPPLPPKGKKRKVKGSGYAGSEGKSAGGGGVELDHEIHIWTERERRKKMKNMFSDLHALLPQLPPKVDKSTIVYEAVNYITSLEQELYKLQRIKLERLHSVPAIRYQTSITTPPKLGTDTWEAFLANQASTRSNNLGVNQTNISNPMPICRFVPPAFQTWTSPNVVLNICVDQAQFNICAMKKPGLFTAICYVMEKHNIDVVQASITSDNFRAMYLIQAQARMISDRQKPETTFQVAAEEIVLWVSS